MIDITPPATAPGRDPATRRNDPLWAKAQALEATFLSEMLGYAGVGTPSDSFGGGIGEEQFASFLRERQSQAIVQKGGIGLAESLFNALTEVRDGR
jgi:peptidoglycan hydrolase FlgJ